MESAASGGTDHRGATLTRAPPSRHALDPVAKAETLHARALNDAFSGRYDLSHRRVRHALDLLGAAQDDQVRLADAGAATWDDVSAERVRVRLLVLLAGMEYELSGGRGGRDHLNEAIALSESIGARDLAFVVNQTLALRATRSGLIDEALTHFAAAEALAADATDLDVCKMLVNRGTLQLERLELDSARQDFELCLSRAEGKPHLVTLAMMARHNLGYVEFLAGNLPAALRAMSEAAELGGQASSAVALLDRARVLIAAGLIDAADRTLTEAADQFRHGRMWAYLAEAELARAECALLTGSFGRARALAGSARTRFRRRGNDVWRRRSELTLLAGDLADGRPPTLLVGPATRVAEEFAAAHLPTYAKEARLISCEALIASGRVADAKIVFDNVGRSDRTDGIVLRLQQRTVAALLSQRRGDRATAHREVQLGLSELGRHQAQFGSIDLQTASALHGRRLMTVDLEMALAAGRPAGVFAALERGRALSRRLLPVTPPPAQSAPLLTELRQLTENLAAIGADPEQSVAAARIRMEIADLQDQLHRIAWRSDGSGNVARHVGLAPVQELVSGSDRQMVLYGRMHGELVAVVLGIGRSRLVQLPGTGEASALLSRLRADLNVMALPSPPPPLRRSAVASATRCLSRLDALLLAPLKLAADRVVVVPTADLSTLPWNALPSLRDRPVEVSPTASAWWHGWHRTTGRPVRVGAFAGPGLLASEHEVLQLRNIWPQIETFVGQDATRRALAQTAGSVTIAHVAAHGTHVSQNPLFSSLHLADGPLFAYELDAEHVPPHVVLSACELGQVTVRPGEEALGLTSVLLQLGVRCVVAGVANVNDDLAADVMVDYHQRLAAGSDAAAALADAIAARGTPVPFSCFGAAWSL
jgi:tetratricopeptide (TPR) repeat protein